MHLEPYSVPPNPVVDAVPTVAMSWIKRRQKLMFFHDMWINFLGFIVGLISRCCSRRALVKRSLCLKWLTMSFPTSNIPAILFLNFADDALQVTSPKAHSASRTFPGGPAFAAWKWTLHCYKLWFSMAKATVVSRIKFLRDLLTSVAPKKNNKSKQADKSPQQNSHPWQQRLVEASDARAGLEGDR